MNFDMPHGGVVQERAPNLEKTAGIMLSNDARVIAILEKKLVEYQERADAAVQSGVVNLDAAFKHVLLSRLLRDGYLDKFASYQEFFGSVQRPHEDTAIFNNAFEVIRSYNANHTERLIGGTGV